MDARLKAGHDECVDDEARVTRFGISLARLRVTEGRHNDAKAILALIYDQFTEGFETADLRAARDILNAPPS
jgi:hypothetical protein